MSRVGFFFSTFLSSVFPKHNRVAKENTGKPTVIFFPTGVIALSQGM